MKRLPLLAVLTVALGTLAQAAPITSLSLFSGTSGGTASVSTTGSLLSGNSATGSLGSGYSGTVTAGAAFSTSSVTVNDTATPNEVVFSSNALVSLAPTFTISKTFTGQTLAANTTYVFTLTTTNSGILSLLSGINVDLKAGVNDIANTATGTGLSSVINLLGLFSGNTATFSFTTSAGVDTTDPVSLTFGGSGLLSAGSNSVTFSGATLAAQSTPEPATYALLGLAAMLGIVLRRRQLFGAI